MFGLLQSDGGEGTVLSLDVALTLCYVEIAVTAVWFLVGFFYLPNCSNMDNQKSAALWLRAFDALRGGAPLDAARVPPLPALPACASRAAATATDTRRWWPTAWDLRTGPWGTVCTEKGEWGRPLFILEFPRRVEAADLHGATLALHGADLDMALLGALERECGWAGTRFGDDTNLHDASVLVIHLPVKTFGRLSLCAYG